MNPIVKQVSPHATKLIRSDHAFVLAQYHKLEPGLPAATRAAVVRNICSSLEIHAQIEEEIFYPALRACGVDSPALARSQPDHDEMRRLIERVRVHEQDHASAPPRIKGAGLFRQTLGNHKSSRDQAPTYGRVDPADRDPVFAENGDGDLHEDLAPVEDERHMNDPNEAVHELMKAVLHHVADEESDLLPAAEQLFSPQRLAELGAEMTARRLHWARHHAAELAIDRARAAPAKTALVTVGALVAGSLLVTSLRRGRHHGRL